MNKFLTYSLALASLTFATSCSDNNANTDHMDGDQNHMENGAMNGSTMMSDSTAMPGGMAAMSYTCPMHPEIHQSGPGQCPKCHMDLVKEETAPAPAAQ